jgi:hypothetical protein
MPMLPPEDLSYALTDFVSKSAYLGNIIDGLRASGKEGTAIDLSGFLEGLRVIRNKNIPDKQYFSLLKRMPVNDTDYEALGTEDRMFLRSSVQAYDDKFRKRVTAYIESLEKEQGIIDMGTT